MRLARAAGRAAEHRGASLAVLAKRVIDPVLRASAGGGDLDVGELEDLNFLRERINIYLSRHSIRV
jgi:hypothetical protein